MSTLFDTWLGRVVAAVVAGGVLAGLSGLVIAGGTRSDVESLKEDAVLHESRITKATTEIASLKTEVANLKEAVKEGEKVRREDDQRLNDKLDKILERLPPR